MDRKDKIAGCLFGLLIGDMLSLPLKPLKYDERKRYFPVNNLVEPFSVQELIEETDLSFNDIKHRIYSWHPAGIYSFYGQQALLVFDSVVKSQSVDIEDISQRLVKYSFPRDKSSPLGIFRWNNRQFFESIQNIANGLPLKVCGVPHCIGDSAFKIIPIALFYGNAANEMKDNVVDITLLTNRDVQAIASAGAIGYTISQASSKSFFNVDEELNRIINFTRLCEETSLRKYKDFLQDSSDKKHVVSEALKELYNLKDRSLGDGINYYLDLSHKNGLSDMSSVAITGISLLLFIKNIGNFEQTIKTTLEQNLAIEIITPIVGAIAGSLCGINKIPQSWKELVENQKDIFAKSEKIKWEDKPPEYKNFYIKELELCEKQYQQKESQIRHLEENFNTVRYS